MNACTIIARNYLPAAIVLGETFRDHHPDGTFTVLLVDGGSRDLDDQTWPFTIVRPSQLPIDPSEFARMAMIYSVMELATAIKPWLLEHLVAEGKEAMYFDPDIEIFAPLDDLADLARRHGIVLTPHSTVPIPRDGKRISEAEILAAGIYNLGFIGVGPQSRDFLHWWQERLRRDCVVDPAHMLFVDQRWIDFVPGYYDHVIVHDPGVNVAYWNLHGRELRWTGSSYTVNGHPLRFFHFSGYQPDVPYVLSKHQGDNPRILLSEHPNVARLCHAYGERLIAAGYGTRNDVRYPYDWLPNGVPVDRRMRRLFRAALREAENRGTALPPDPLDPGYADQFVAWLNQPDPDAVNPRITRYLRALWSEREDLQSVFSRQADPTGDEYLRWVAHTGQRENAIPEALIPTSRAQSPSAPTGPGETWKPGLNVAGYFRAELGVGEAARQLLTAVQASGIDYSTVTYMNTMSRQDHPFDDVGDPREPYDINLVCVNADQTPGFAQTAGRQLFDGRYTIGLWFWETEDFPAEMAVAFEYVDEVWAASEHVRRALARISTKPVHTVPLPIVAPSYPAALTRDDLDLPTGFIFLFSFDFLSVLDRKNPLGLIHAFARAFPTEQNVSLVIKTINGHKRPLDLERLRTSAAAHPHIHIVDKYLPSEYVSALTALADCYVSLHRAEGFGLTIAEAMALGKPVIATEYGGNVDFMTAENSYPVRYRMVPIGPGNEPYLPTGRWADPDLDQCAALMREVYQHPDRAASRGQRAQHDIEMYRSPEAGGQFIRQRTSEIRRQRDAEARSGGHAHVPDGSRSPFPTAASPVAARPDDTAMEFFTRGPDPGTPTRRGGPWAGSVRLARRAVYRLLRNYHDQQRYAGRLTVQAVRDLEVRFQTALDSLSSQVANLSLPRQDDGVDLPERHRLSDLEQRLRQTESHSVDDHTQMTGRLHEVEERVAGVQQRLDDVMADMQRRFAAFEEHVSDLGPHVLDIDERVRDIRVHISGIDDRLAAHDEVVMGENDRLGDVTTRITSVSQRVDLLSKRLHEVFAQMDAVPFMTAPSALSATSLNGRRVIGYLEHVDGGHGGNRQSPDVYMAFENMFRGDETFIAERQRKYVDYLLQHAPVLDLGCGRGEMLALLAEAGVDARGVDINPVMVDRCRERGLDVRLGDAVHELEAQQERSLGAVFSSQLIEHLPYERLLALLTAARRALRPEGLLILETVNPHSFRAMKTFWVDLTHEKPIFPEVLVQLCRSLGYREAMVTFPNGVGELEIDRRLEGEYAVIATPGGATRLLGLGSGAGAP